MKQEARGGEGGVEEDLMLQTAPQMQLPAVSEETMAQEARGGRKS